MNPSDVDVIVLNYRTPELAARAARSAAQDGADSIWIVDNGSGNGVARLNVLVSGFAQVLSLPHNIGFSAGNNRGASHTERPIILFMNADTELQAGALRAMLRPFGNPSVAAVGPVLHYPDHREQPSALLVPTAWRITAELLHLDALAPQFAKPLFASNVDPKRNGPYCGTVHSLYGACFAIRRTAFEAVGGFDEDFFLYLDETDLFVRLRSAGYTLYRVTDAHVFHHHSQSAKTIPVQSLLFSQQSRFIYGKKHFSSTAQVQVTIASVLGNLLRLLARVRSYDDRIRYWAALGYWLGWVGDPDPRRRPPAEIATTMDNLP